MSGSVGRVLERLEGVKRSGAGWMAKCPGHEDRNASLSVSNGDKGAVLHCHAGCSTEAVVRAIGLDMKDLFDEPSTNGNGKNPPIIATYAYTDENGVVLSEVCRTTAKTFPQRRPNGSGGWVWGLGDVRRVLFHLPQLLEAVALDKLVHVVEGEKDVLAIERAGGVATTNPMGADEWQDEYSEHLRGARVRIVADRDLPGIAHAHDVAASLEGIAASVELVQAKVGKDAADHLAAGLGLDDFVPLTEAPEPAAEPPPRKLAAPVGITDLLAAPEPKEEWLSEGSLPAGGNILTAGYPKTFKTKFACEEAVSLATATPFLGRFRVPVQRRVGLVLMEDQAHQIRRTLRRICLGRGMDLRDLEGWLYCWFRPPLRLSDQTVVELGRYAAELSLDLLIVDSWAYVASGDSNSSDDVTPQLQALSGCRLERPGLTVQLTHHARKEKGEGGEIRLTDMIRNSSAFGAWYDAGLVLSRRDETSPVTVRTELRDHATPEPFAFTVEDEDPAGPHNGFRSGGWLRLTASEHRPELLTRIAAAEKLVPAVVQFLEQHPGCSKRKLREGVKGKAEDVDAALELLEKDGKAEVRPGGPGKSASVSLRAET